MNSTLIVIIIVLLLVIIIALISIVILVLKKSSLKENTVEIKSSATSHKSFIGDDFCQVHEKTQSQGLCAICSSGFCEECLRENEGLNFCSEHFRFYLAQDWIELKTVKTTPDTPETAMPFYRLKEKLWLENKTPTLVRTHYKIDVEEDIIESHVKFISRKEDSVTISNQLKKAFS